MVSKVVFDRFKILRYLRQERSGYTAVATDLLASQSDVIVKTIRRDVFSASRTTVMSFFSWLRTNTHPNVGPVIAAGYGPGRDLFWVRPHFLQPPIRPSTQEQAIVLIRDLVSAVSCFRRRDRLHRRIRPENVFFENGSFVLVDGHPAPVLAERCLEDIHFLAPEVLRGEETTIASDFYALGATLYWILSGRHIFEDASPETLRAKYFFAAPPTIEADVPEFFARQLEGLFARNPSSRLTAFDALEKLVAARARYSRKASYVGRAKELGTIQAHVCGVSQPLSIISIHAGCGLGKTALLEEIGRRCPFYPIPVDFVLLRCAPELSLSNLLRAPLRELLERHCHRRHIDLRSLLGPYYSSLGPLFFPEDLESDLPITARRLFDIVGLIGRISESRRILFAVDDIHHASPEVTTFLRHLGMRASEICGHILLTSDHFNLFAAQLIEECSVPQFRMFGLLPLGDNAISRIFSELKGSPTSDDLVIAAGNPLFAELEYTGNGLINQSEAIAAWIHNSLHPISSQGKELIQALALLECSISTSLLQTFVQFTDDEFRAAAMECMATSIAHISDHASLRHAQVVRLLFYRLIGADTIRGMHERAFHLLQPIASDALLASHAANAFLYRESAELSLRIAVTAERQKHYLRAVEHYSAASRALNILGMPLPIVDQAALASCYSYLGRYQTAEEIFNSLLRSPEIERNPELKAEVYRRRATRYSLRDTERLRQRVAALKCLPVTSPDMRRVLTDIGTLLAQMGRLRGARIALSKVEGSFGKHGEHEEERDKNYLLMAKGVVEMNSGEFHAALSYFSIALSYFEKLATMPRLPRDSVMLSIPAVGNSALCYELIGDFPVAIKLLQRIVTYAQVSHSVSAQLLSHNNIGAIYSICGNYSSAGESFEICHQLYVQCRSNDSTFSLNNELVFECDRANYYLRVGLYSQAIPLFEGIDFEAVAGALNSMAVGLLVCDFWVHLVHNDEARAVISRLRKHALAEIPHFKAEVDMMELTTGLPGACKFISHRLIQRVESTKSPYQRCRVLYSLAASHLSMDQPDLAAPYIDDALRIANENGYQPLEAQAMLLKGRTSEQPEDKELWFFRAFKAATEMGTPELIAESAYYLGALFFEADKMADAQKFLLKSTVTTSQLVEQIPYRYRERYLDEAWRRLARERLRECVSSMELILAKQEKSPAEQGDRLFQALYHVNVAGATASTADGFIQQLIHVLDELTGRSAVIHFQRDERPQWFAVRSDLTDELKQRVSAIGMASKGLARFEYQDRELTRGAIAWIPFQSQYASGGIYVSSGAAAPPLGEREMEFLTMLGAMTSAVLERLGSRAPEPMQPSAALETMRYGIVGTSRQVHEVISRIELAAASTATTLIEGETGTGKELVAKAIHTAGPRASGPFIAVDCGAIPEGLIESELFGAVRGAYTGAMADRTGLFEAANHGTIFLDEISNTPTSLQAKLLRVLQEREVRRVGDNRVRPVDVRLIAATNQNLNALADAGAFRRDLLYRLNVLHVELPPLRNRRGDIPLLADHFLGLLNTRHRMRKYFAPTALEPLAPHRFPGNIRELQNLVERAFFAAKNNMITAVIPEASAVRPATDEISELDTWFRDLTEGRKDFWTAVHDRYKRRDISRENLVALVDLGLRRTRGNYKELAILFRLDHRSDYRRLMDFLRRNDCLLDFRPYRKAAEPES